MYTSLGYLKNVARSSKDFVPKKILSKYEFRHVIDIYIYHIKVYFINKFNENPRTSTQFSALPGCRAASASGLTSRSLRPDFSQIQMP